VTEPHDHRTRDHAKDPHEHRLRARPVERYVERGRPLALLPRGGPGLFAEASHRGVGGEDLATEDPDPSLLRRFGERLEDDLAEAPPLVVVDDGDRCLRDLAIPRQAHEAPHADALLGLEIE